MSARLAIALLAASAVSRALCADPAFEVEPYLDATREIEDWQGRDGRHGERGAYGIREAAWRQHMGGMPFAAARQERWGRECARRHVAWLRHELARSGVHTGVFNVALAYNAGLARVLSGRVPERAYDYANRLSALYQGRALGRQSHARGKVLSQLVATRSHSVAGDNTFDALIPFTSDALPLEDCEFVDAGHPLDGKALSGEVRFHTPIGGYDNENFPHLVLIPDSEVLRVIDSGCVGVPLISGFENGFVQGGEALVGKRAENVGQGRDTIVLHKRAGVADDDTAHHAVEKLFGERGINAFEKSTRRDDLAHMHVRKNQGFYSPSSAPVPLSHVAQRTS